MGLFRGTKITHVGGRSFIKWDNIGIALFVAFLIYLYIVGS